LETSGILPVCVRPLTQRKADGVPVNAEGTELLALLRARSAAKGDINVYAM
jgi:hypothetical protein